MNTITSLDITDKKESGVQQPVHDGLCFPFSPLTLGFVLILAIAALTTSSTGDAWAQGTVPPGTVPPGTVPPPAVIYLGFKSSDEIESAESAQADFVYRNEDIVAFTPATGQFVLFFDGSVCGLADANLDDFEILENGNLIFTLRSTFVIPGLGEVDDSDVIEYTPNPADCGVFSVKLKGADVGLTQGIEDIDALGIAEDGNLLVSTIGTAKVPGSAGELVVKDQSLIKFDASSNTWSLYFDGSDVGLTKGSEDIRSAWKDPVTDAQGYQHIYLTLSGDFAVESNNIDKGNKNDVEGCALLQSGDTTTCYFFRLLDGENAGAKNQLDGLAVQFGVANAASAITGRDSTDQIEAAETASDAADFAEALAEGDSEVTIEDFLEIASHVYLPYVGQ